MKLADNPDAMAEVNAAFGDLCVAFASTGLAVVAVVEGTVMGGGFGLACVADVALADESVVFRLPETGLGLVPAQVAPFLVERLGYAEAKRLAVTGAAVDASEALRLRLVHQVQADAEALDWALQRCWPTSCAARPGALAATKHLMAKARLHSPASLVHEAAETFARAALGAEGRRHAGLPGQAQGHARRGSGMSFAFLISQARRQFARCASWVPLMSAVPM
jgi:isohexenylglutaconyl-CoA hydratase